MKKKYNKGFTLVEMLLSMGILLILIGILTTLFGQIIDTQLASSATSVVDQDGRYILAKLTYDMQTASSIVAPASPGTATTVTLKSSLDSVNYTYSLTGGNLQIASSSATNVLNSVETGVSSLSFQRIGSGGANDTIRVQFTLTSKTQRIAGPTTKTFQTTVGLP